MNESLAGRVGRIISGSLNSLVSAVENAAPDMVMEEAIREVDSAIDEVRAELGRVAASKHLSNTRLMEENRLHSELSEQIAVAVSEGRDDLAEAGISRQLDIEAQMPVLEKAIADAGDTEKELESYIQALQAKKREMKNELERLREVRRQSDVPGSGGDTVGASGGGLEGKVAKAESAFERVLERQTGVGSAASPDADTAKRLAELEELSRQNRIKERLAAIKSDRKE